MQQDAQKSIKHLRLSMPSGGKFTGQENRLKARKKRAEKCSSSETQINRKRKETTSSSTSIKKKKKKTSDVQYVFDSFLDLSQIHHRRKMTERKHIEATNENRQEMNVDYSIIEYASNSNLNNNFEY